MAGCSVAFAQTAHISLWLLGDMTLRMESRDADRTLLVEKLPASKARALGISAGATLWQGSRKGDRLIGEAFSYKANCPPLRYEATGNAKLDARGRLVLTGLEPSRAANGCERGPTSADRATSWTLTLKGKPTDFKDEE
ncbi:hypothetical protein [Terrarubrum flagellatum]|uniref:hypothetical protein n=1 Tax=Terrirubrum flagellatum TaxID=2895980 RepID=UPI003144EC83